MKRLVIGLTLTAVLAASGVISGQEKPRPVAASEIKISPALVFAETSLFMKDGSVAWGRLIGAGAESIRIRQEGEDLDISRLEINKVVVNPKKNRSKGIIPGAVLGLYVGNGLVSLAGGTPDSGRGPGFYLQHGDWGLSGLMGIIAESAFVAAGGALGWLFGSIGGAEAFEFSGGAEDGQKSWERFLSYLGGIAAPRRVHLLFLGGPVDLRVSRGFDDAIRDAGYSPPWFHSWASNFAVLRAFQADYSLSSRLHAGLRISFPGEPFRSTSFTGESGEDVWILQRFGATALHGICSVEPLSRVLPWFMSWNAGLGAGFATVRLERRSRISWNGSRLDDQAENRKVLPSGVVFSTLEFRVTDILSLGVAADFTFIPAGPFPALPDAGIPEQKIGLSNASAGFVLGYHF